MVLFWYLSVPVALRRHATLRTPHGGSDAQLRTLAHVVEDAQSRHTMCPQASAPMCASPVHTGHSSTHDHLRFRLRFGRNGDARPVARDARPPPPRIERRSLPLLARDDVLDADTPRSARTASCARASGAARSVETPDELLLDRALSKLLARNSKLSRSSASIAFSRSASRSTLILVHSVRREKDVGDHLVRAAAARGADGS